LETQTPKITAAQAILKAQDALRRGEKQVARHWARLAATLAPDREEPWLLLAVLASPIASIGFLKQALKINPQSKRAQAGMLWALKRVEEAAKTSAAAPLPSPAPAARAPLPVIRPAQPKKGAQNALAFLLVSALLLTLGAFVIFQPIPGMTFFNIPAFALSQPTANATPAPGSPALKTAQAQTVSPSRTPQLVAISTVLPDPGPTATAEIEMTPTALPTDGGPGSATNDAGQPTVPPYTGTKRVEVSISEQHMYVYEGDTLVFSFVASTGMNSATRVGNFAILDKIPNAYGSTWDLWMPNWLGIYYSGNIENGIHALPILSNGVTLWSGYLGSPISYGCIVLSTYDSQLLYDWVDLGVPVNIRY
jgi:lipoprotein-anchoring transpeptidase ErfK/SrfK